MIEYDVNEILCGVLLMNRKGEWVHCNNLYYILYRQLYTNKKLKTEVLTLIVTSKYYTNNKNSTRSQQIKIKLGIDQ